RRGREADGRAARASAGGAGVPGAGRVHGGGHAGAALAVGVDLAHRGRGGVRAHLSQVGGMNAALPVALASADWLLLLAYFLSVSLLSVGGALAAAPDMHRFLVDRHGWITDPQFTASIAIAQAAPGPNVLFVALLGWNIGLN